ncbi:hypothetical protein Q8791_23545 [Nocardiopsis sp. CT-R113]|uniref:Uncharacterized protein n=1 Tax=Nocardiopsis codii TaxID=3065942 RepID=A0ABU7KD90_9ACTN|nr:hypothetical protein [Nocardiopsis sp. CT-R113]MEE2040196.1 hypothetical protein [Nocardiopsis sp. CT-R113]
MTARRGAVRVAGARDIEPATETPAPPVPGRRVVLEGGPLHGDVYTVADSLPTVELPKVRRRTLADIMRCEEPPTVMYHRDPRRPSVFTHFG